MKTPLITQLIIAGCRTITTLPVLAGFKIGLTLLFLLTLTGCEGCDNRPKSKYKPECTHECTCPEYPGSFTVIYSFPTHLDEEWTFRYLPDWSDNTYEQWNNRGEGSRWGSWLHNDELKWKTAPKLKIYQTKAKNNGEYKYYYSTEEPSFQTDHIEIDHLNEGKYGTSETQLSGWLIEITRITCTSVKPADKEDSDTAKAVKAYLKKRDECPRHQPPPRTGINPRLVR